MACSGLRGCASGAQCPTLLRPRLQPPLCRPPRGRPAASLLPRSPAAAPHPAAPRRAAPRTAAAAAPPPAAGLSSLDGYEREPSELQKLIDAIPYRKLCLWGLVGLFLWPLHDFFGVMEAVERAVLLSTSNDITRAAVEAGHDWTAERSTQLGLAVSGMLKGYTTTAASIISGALKSVTRFTIQVFVALILGFFMLWDLPKISRGVASLKQSRLAPIYEEVAPVLGVFGKLFGKALEAQARIAVVNTALTALGMWALAIPGVGLLSLFVFVCSFIPIAGVIISTSPIAFVALTEYGFMKLALVLLMVTGVHFVEAYALNPAIYSAHLKLHPLLVLCALVVAEHSLGVWGLLLAVPLTVFALDYLIRYPDSSVTEVGVKELEKVMRADEHEEERLPGMHQPI
ncbi:hypothetical protein Rsub_10464 [Raphidocelis subcapitata]|uniref:AI-2E family transporter n=1 Tax=Raphidocelis subcapitata TaxID=307507 RepID=A0A2V0PFT7_9CHLO|nr:hypothetical protein Rsub_10464 [Raphidocelis subcapitata]|eukprot:GBF98399.1 hypothetical protein Rsub_10464 [Raphidocelis subcapitata]